MSTQTELTTCTYEIIRFAVLFICLIVILRLVYKFKNEMMSALWRVFRGLPLIGCAATAFVGLIFLPGTFLHECSHALLARLIGWEVTDFSLRPREKEGSIELGHVDSEGESTFFAGLTGLAPLLVGSLVVSVILRYGFGMQSPAFHEGVPRAFETVYHIGQSLIQKPLLIYLLFVFGNSALPSRKDYKHLPYTLMMLLALGLTMYVVGSQTIPGLSNPEWWLRNLNILILAFSVVLLLNVVISIPLRILFG
jgi:hypothetical protein